MVKPLFSTRKGPDPDFEKEPKHDEVITQNPIRQGRLNQIANLLHLRKAQVEGKLEAPLQKIETPANPGGGEIKG